MYKYSANNVTPIVSEHGEIVYELIGPNVGEATQRHSVAHVVIPPGKSSFETEKIFHGRTSNKLPKDIQRTARRKLIYLDDAENLQDLLAPPANRLEKLKGDRAGQYSIRINDQWRICLRWSDNEAKDVEIVDYHG